MDTFDLKWPRTQATFFTDGWRCRIVWRQQGGPGGTIDNIVLCKRRVADSLTGAPYLLPALRARGYGNLAAEIEALVTDAPRAGVGAASQVPPAAATAPNPASRKSAPPKAAPRKRSPGAPVRTQGAPAHRASVERVTAWIEAIDGSATHAEIASARAKQWAELGELGDASLALKPPAEKGKREWVLRQSFADRKRKTEYIGAPHLKGILSYLASRAPKPRDAYFESLLTRCAALGHPEVAAASSAWQKLAATTH